MVFLLTMPEEPVSCVSLLSTQMIQLIPMYPCVPIATSRRRSRGEGRRGSDCVTKIFPTSNVLHFADIDFVNFLVMYSNKDQSTLILHSECSILLWRNRPSFDFGLVQDIQMFPDLVLKQSSCVAGSPYQ